MLEAKNICLTLGDKKLFEGLSFSVSAGEMLCITGASGCGKTSLLKALMGFVPLDGGFISIDGELLTAESSGAFRRMMAYLPQDLSFPCNSVSELVTLPFSLKANASSAFSKEQMMEEWKKLDLQESLFDKSTNEISGGQRLRMMVAATRMLNKKIMIIDEPTSALDEHSAMLVADYIDDAARNGACVVAVSHNPLFAAKCTKTIAL